MPSKIVKFSQDARDRVLKGVNLLADTVIERRQYQAIGLSSAR
jgi:hypothetical protein